MLQRVKMHYYSIKSIKLKKNNKKINKLKRVIFRYDLL